MDLAAILRLLHNFNRWVVVIMLVLVIGRAILALVKRLERNPLDRQMWLVLTIAADVQLLLGLILFVLGPWLGLLSRSASVVMKDPNLRFFSIEHTLIGIIVVVLIHVASIRFRKADTSRQAFQQSLIFIGIVALLVLYSGIIEPTVLGRAIFW
jgi:hypothetical protein